MKRKTPGAHVRQLRLEIQSLLSKLAEEDDEKALPSSFATNESREPAIDEVLNGASGLVNRSLSEALRLEEKAHAECRASLEASALEWREASCDYEVQIESLRLELSAAKAHARKLERSSDQAEAFADYEKLASDLRRTCAALRARNVDLERSCCQQKTMSPPGVYASNKEAKVVRRLEGAVADLEAENASLRKALRGLPLAERIAKSQTRVAQARAQDLHKAQRELDKERRKRDEDQLHIQELRRSQIFFYHF